MESIKHLPTRYSIIDSLGKGGIGQVFQVHDSLRNQICALKIINRAEPKSKDALIQEFKLLSDFQHPNLVQVYDFGFLTLDVPYFTMEFIDGPDLNRFFTAKSNLASIKQVIKDILAALIYLNEKGTIHGDIKPENIMVIRSQEFLAAKLLDFGLAAHLDHKRAGISGTLRFLSPEIISAQRYTAASDLYALGLTLFESITKIQIPPPDKFRNEFYRSMYSNLMKSLSASNIKNPSSLAAFILFLSQYDIEDRPQSPQEAFQAFSLKSEDTDSSPPFAFEDTFIGRVKETNEINTLITDIDSSAKSIIVEGIQGIGKKSIFRRIIKNLQVEGYLILDLFSNKYNSNPFDHFIDNLADNLNERDCSAFRAAHNNILSINREKNLNITEVSKKDQALVMYDNIIKHINELSKDKPVLICIPDVERFSEDFLRFIGHMLHEAKVLNSRIIVILSRNTSIPFKSDSFDMIMQYSLPPLPIEPLSEEELNLLLNEYFGTMIFSKNEFNEFIQRTHCIPIAVTELVRHLISTNAIEYLYNRWHFNKTIYDDTYLPETTTDLILETLKALDVDEKRVIEILAIYGKPMPIALLARVFNKDIALVQNIIEKLTKRLLIKDNQNIIEFKNPINIQLIRKRISQKTIIAINKQIAIQLINSHPEYPFDIAYHCIEGRMTIEALEYGLKTVDEMISQYQYYDAYSLSKKIYGLISKKGNREQKVSILQRLAPIEQQTGHPIDAISTYKLLSNYEVDDNIKALYIKQIALIHYVLLGQTDKAISHFNEALELAKISHNKELQSIILMDLGRLIGEDGLALTKQAADIAKEVNDSLYAKALSRLLYLSEMAGETKGLDTISTQIDLLINEADNENKKDILFNLYMVNFYRSNYKKAKELIKEKIELEELTDDPIGKIYSLSSLGGIYYVNGEYFQQIQILDKALLIARKYNHYLMALTIISNMLIAYRHLAEYDKSIKLLDQADGLIVDNKITQINAIYLLKPTYLFMLLGEKTEHEFKKYLNRTRTRARKYSNTIALGHCYLMLSKYYYQKLNVKHSYSNAQKAYDCFLSSDDKDDMVDTLAAMSLCLTEANDPDAAIKKALNAQLIYDKIQCKYLEPLLLLSKGVTARIKKLSDTEMILSKALRTSKKMGTRETTWQLQRELALYYAERDELGNAISFYKEAIETIKQITESISDEKLKVSYLSVPFRKRVFDEIKAIKRRLT